MAGKIKQYILDHPLRIILICGVLIRLAFLLEYLADPQWNQLLVDSLFHHRWAETIADGAVLGEEPFFRAPFYIYVLGLIYWLSGGSLLAARIFGHLVGMAGVWATFTIGDNLFGKRIALIAGLLHALYPIAIYYESELLVDSLFTTLVLFAALFYLRALKSRKTSDIIATGMLIGVAAITRPVILGMIPLFLFWYWYEIRNIRQSLLNGIIMLAAIAIPILPVTIRNTVVGDNPVMIASSGGINFYIGNNPASDGYSSSLPAPLLNSWEIRDIEYLAEKETGHRLGASEVSSFYYRKGFNWILQNPERFLGLYLTKLKFAFNNLEISNNRNLSYFTGSMVSLKIIPLNFALVISLGIFGLTAMLLGKNYPRPALFIALFILWYIVMMALFFINARFRLPVIPLIIIFSASGIGCLIDTVQNSRLNKITGIALTAGILALIVSLLPVSEVDSSDTKSALFNRANFELKNENYSEAIALYNQLLEENPGYPDVNLNLGAVLLKMGQLDRAEDYFKREMELFPKKARVYSNLASLYYIRKQYRESLSMAEYALELKPYLADAQIIRLRNFYNLGDTTALSQAIHDGETVLSNPSNLYLEAGIIYTSLGEYDIAENYLTRALNAERNPAETDDQAFNQVIDSDKAANRIRARAAYQLGYLYGITGKTARSLELTHRAIAIDSNLVEAYINLYNGYFESGWRDSASAALDLARRKFPNNRMLRSFIDNLNH